MAKQLLTDTTFRNAKPEAKDKRLNDGGGLYLLIKPNDAKWWRFDYTIRGKRKTPSIGVYPTIGLADARRKANEARTTVANGTDPSDIRKSDNAAQQQAAEQERHLDAGLPIINSFEHICRDWLAATAHSVRDILPTKRKSAALNCTYSQR